MTDSLAALAGQLLVVGFPAEELTPALKAGLRTGRRAGVILFRRNLHSAEQLRALCTSVQAERPSGESPLLVAIDEEGGRVSRLPKPEPVLGAMRALGERKDEALIERSGLAIGARLAELGVNLNFAPVLDVDSNPANPVIGDRSFSTDATEVARFGLAFARGLNQGGVLACGKHFPGHGDTDKDSHFDLPVIRHARPRLEAVELLPFRAAAQVKLDSMMSAHIVVEALAQGPATLSSAVMTELLRKELGYEGVLFSDDLEMRAVLDLHPPAESAVLAIAAGCDSVLVCKEEENSEAAFEGLLHELEKSAAFRARVAEAAGRMQALRVRAASLFEARAKDAPSVADVKLG